MGGHDVVLLHGQPGSAADWRQVADRLPEALRVVALDRPGYGASRQAAGGFVFNARAVLAELDARGIGRAVLVGKFGRHPAVAPAAAFLSSFQAGAGDYWGIYGRQYTPNYSAAITELLIRTGYEGSAQVEKTMRWLLSMRQNDGGWAIPSRTLDLPLKAMLTAGETLEPGRSPPSSHLITGIVLRALAAHSCYRHSAATRQAAVLLKSRFFLRDTYPDRAAPSYWLILSYPYWWTDLLSGLDSLSQIGFRTDDLDIARGVAWFIDNQEANGLWNTGHNRPKRPDSDLWVGLAICRMLRAIWADEA